MMYQKYFDTGRAALRIPLIFDKHLLCHGKYSILAPCTNLPINIYSKGQTSSPHTVIDMYS